MIPKSHASSERGIALIVVLLLMAVLSGLATGFALTGQVESQMGQNEVYFAGARAAAEAGMNRAIVKVVADTTHDLLAGPDFTLDPLNPTASVNADNGSLSFLLGGSGPFPVDANGQYTYTVQVLDDDDTSLYQTALTSAQLTQMNENGNQNANSNDRLILKVTGFGPKGTTVTIKRILETVDHTATATTTTSLANPAILVNGDLDISGSIAVMGTSGSVHANGNLTISGNAATVTQNATATGTFTANQNWHSGGAQGGGRSTVQVPDVHASDYIQYADYKLTSTGAIQTRQGGVWTNCSSGPCNSTGWSWNASTGWSIAGNTAGSGTYYVEGNATVSGSPNGGGNGNNATNLALSIIATGDIRITGTPKFTPENSAKIEFVTDKDLVRAGNSDLDDPTSVEGQIMVREQVSIHGNPEFQGRILVENATDTGGISSSEIPGNPTITYNGTLGAIATTTTTPGSITYVNNVHGWIEE